MTHQRRRTRVSAQKEATIRWTGGEFRSRLDNLSLKGCLVAGAQRDLPDEEVPVELVVHLEPDDASFDFIVRGRVVRVIDRGVAIDFTEVPAESFPNLFRLVQYNAPDPEDIEGELTSSAFGTPLEE